MVWRQGKYPYGQDTPYGIQKTKFFLLVWQLSHRFLTGLSPFRTGSQMGDGHFLRQKCARPALYTSDIVWAGVCTLEPAGTVQTPSGTPLPVRKVPAVASGHCTKSLSNAPPSAQTPALYTGDPVRTGLCTVSLSASSALYTGGNVWTGLCTLGAAGTVQTPSGTTLPVRKVPGLLLRALRKPRPPPPGTVRAPSKTSFAYVGDPTSMPPVASPFLSAILITVVAATSTSRGWAGSHDQA